MSDIEATAKVILEFDEAKHLSANAYDGISTVIPVNDLQQIVREHAMMCGLLAEAMQIEFEKDGRVERFMLKTTAGSWTLFHDGTTDDYQDALAAYQAMKGGE